MHQLEEVRLLKCAVDGLQSKAGISSFSAKPKYSDADDTRVCVSLSFACVCVCVGFCVCECVCVVLLKPVYQLQEQVSPCCFESDMRSETER